MRILVITTDTKDFGTLFVVREHVDGVPTVRPIAVCETLEEARGAVEEDTASLVCLPRADWDDRVIVESWGSRTDVDECLRVQEWLRGGAFL